MLTNPTDISYAAKILAVEAMHSTLVRLLLFQSGADLVKPYPVQVVDLAQARMNLIC